jgi:hypothetical protein
MVRKIVVAATCVALASGALARELTSAYVVTAVANKQGWTGTDWHTDLTLYNPQNHVLYVVLQFLPTGRDNGTSVPTAPLIDLQPWETLNLWDVLGPNGFDARGQTGALLVYADTQANSCSNQAGDTTCDFAVLARNYTLNPLGGGGEFGQDFPGFPANLGVEYGYIAYLPQLSDDQDFITSIGVASWTGAWVTVQVDLQDTAGQVVHHYLVTVPPYSHAQGRVPVGLDGGTAAVYLVDGPNDAMVYPYATVRSTITGDPTTIEAQISSVGLSAQATSLVRRVSTRREAPRALPAPSFSVERLKHRTN